MLIEVRIPPVGATVQAAVSGKGIKQGVVVAHDTKDGQSIFDFETDDGSLHWATATNAICWQLDGQTSNTRSWRAGGTQDFQTWRVGDRIQHVDCLRVGAVAFKESLQFNAVNLCTITKVDTMRGIAYARFVSPENIQVGRLGYGEEAEFAIWQRELTSSKSWGIWLYVATKSDTLLQEKAVSA
jgi:hypothetical protein